VTPSEAQRAKRDQVEAMPLTAAPRRFFENKGNFKT
jgi:hypothetical protein